MLLDDLAGDVTDGFVASTAVIWALWSRKSIRREAKWAAVLVEEIFLFEAEPSTGIVENSGTTVGRVWGHAVGHHDLAHDEGAIFAGAVWVNGDWLEHAVGAAAFGLLGRATVEAPLWELLEAWEAGEFLDLSFTAKIRHRSVAVEPDVFQFVFGHGDVDF